MATSQKDYIAIASIVKDCMEAKYDTVEMYQAMLVSKLARYFDESYKGAYAFNSAKFRAACYGKGSCGERQTDTE